MKNFLFWLLKKLGWEEPIVYQEIEKEIIKEIPVIQEKVVEVIKEVPVENKEVIIQEKIIEVPVIQEKIIEKEVIKEVPPPLTEEQKKKQYWDNKWPKTDISYYGRILKYESNIQTYFWNGWQVAVDVKNFILDNDQVMKYIINTYNLKKSTYDETVWAIQKFVCEGTMKAFYANGLYECYTASGLLEDYLARPKKVLTYTFDDEKYDAPEYWLFPFETVAGGFGDCEDGALLIASLAINAGVPNYRIKVACGNVDNGTKEGSGGHAYCIYLASDDEWRIIDWCYYADFNISVLQKPLSKNGGQGGFYKDVWFTFNNEFAWNQKSLAITGKLDYINTLEDIIVES